MHVETSSSQERPEGPAEDRDISPTMQAGGLASIPHIHQPVLLQAQRALLERIAISSDDEAYFWTKTQFQALKSWHILHTGWHLEWRNNLFSLTRQPGTITLGYSDSKSPLQTPRDFVYVVWILWYAMNDQVMRRGNGQLFLLIQMLERLTEQWQSKGCLDDLRLDSQADSANQMLILSNRKSMARALKYLQEIKCLQELDGQADAWIEHDSPVLYQFTNAIHMLIMSLDRDAYQAVIAHQKEANIFSASLLPSIKEKVSPLKRAWRALLIGPYLLKFDDPDAFSALLEKGEEIRREVDATFGWFLEINHDYACIIRDRESSPMATGSILLNKKVALDQLVLLLCTAIREQVSAGALHPDYYGRISTTVSDLLDLLTCLREQYGAYWGKVMQEKGDKELLSEMLKRMRRSGLIRGPDDKNTILILPTAARYNSHYQEEPPTNGELRKVRRGQEDAHQSQLWFDDEEITEAE